MQNVESIKISKELTPFNFILRRDLSATENTKVEVAIGSSLLDSYLFFIKSVRINGSWVYKSYIRIPAPLWIYPAENLDPLIGEVQRAHNNPVSTAQFDERFSAHLGNFFGKFVARVVVINRYVYVAFSKFYADDPRGKEYPSKEQVFIPEQGFNKLCELAGEVNRVLFAEVLRLSMDDHY